MDVLEGNRNRVATSDPNDTSATRIELGLDKTSGFLHELRVTDHF